MTSETLDAATELPAYGAVTRLARKNKPKVSAVVFTGLIQAGDAVLVTAASLLGWLAARRLAGVGLGGGDLMAELVAAWVLLLCLKQLDVYRVSRLVSRATQCRSLAIALMVGAGALELAGTIVRGGAVSPVWIVDWLVLNAVLLGAARLAIAPVCARLSSQGAFARRAALVGATETGLVFASELGSREPTDVEIIGIYDDAPAPGAVARAALPLVGDIGQLIVDAQNGMLDAVVIALPASDASRVAMIGDRLGHLALDVLVAPDLGGAPFRQVGTLGGLPVGLLARRPLGDWQVLQKALFDRVLAALLLVMLAPLLLLLALLVRLDSPGPLLFRQRRIGFGNQPFECLKFRTMYHHMTDALADRQTTRGDPRITRVGKWLRRLSLDELPQLLNVLGGEMSIVGPRPHAPNTKAGDKLFQDTVADYARRHRVKPGITGWAQVNGWRGETSTEREIEQRVLHDLHYIQNWSLGWDFRILVLTAVRLCRDPKAY